jgi:hypothetical protein
MTRDLLLLGGLVLAFATLVTAHVTLALGLARRRPRWRGLVALVVVPLAPIWGWRERMCVRGALWIASAIAYAVTLGLTLG